MTDDPFKLMFYIIPIALQGKDGAQGGYVRNQTKVDVPTDAKAVPASIPKPPSPVATPPSNPTPPGATPTSTPTPPSGSSSNSWNIHPSVPIDARLFGVGLLGGAGVYYALNNNDVGFFGDDTKKKPSGQTPPEGGKGSSDTESSTVDFVEDVAPSSLPLDDAAPDFRSEKADTAAVSTSNEEESKTAAGAPVEGDKPQEESEEPEIIVDSHQILGLIEDVLGKSADVMLHEDAETLAKQIVEEGRKQEAEVKKEEIQAAQVAITTAISDTAAESVASDLVKASKGVDAMTPHHHSKTQAASNAPPSTPPTGAPSPPVVVPHVSEALSTAAAKIIGINPSVLCLLGITADITASGLISDAASYGSVVGDNWEEYSYRHKQAESDAKVLAALLTESAKHVEKELVAARDAAAAGHAEAEKARKAAAAQAEKFRSVVEEALRYAEEGHKEQMVLQAEKLANAHMEITIRERAERQIKLDELRMKLGALERALEMRSDAARGSTVAHRMAYGAFALGDALEHGAPIDAAADYLTAVCGDDPLINAALRGLPRGKRVMTSTQLASEFSAVERAAKELSMLPAGKGGLVSAAMAKLLAKLKVKEEYSLAEKIPGGGIDAELAGVEAELVQGKLEGAAGKLEKAVQGTAAAEAVKDWIAAARARAAVEQAAAVVEAHAATATASLA